MVKPDVFKQLLESGKKMMIVDIQVPAEFEKHHFKGFIETNAFPAKTNADKKKLDVVVEKAKASNDNIVIICPRGRSSAVNTYEYLKSNLKAQYLKLKACWKAFRPCPSREVTSVKRCSMPSYTCIKMAMKRLC